MKRKDYVLVKIKSNKYCSIIKEHKVIWSCPFLGEELEEDICNIFVNSQRIRYLEYSSLGYKNKYQVLKRAKECIANKYEDYLK